MRFLRRWCNEDYDGCWPSILLSVAVLCLVSLLMLWLGDRINSQNLVLTRYMARAQAPMVAHFYPDTARRRISVLLYDDEFLEEEGHAWPIPYGAHADWIERLTSEPGARPRALFLDISFGQARRDASLDALIDTLCRVRHEKKIPVYLAGLSVPQAGGLVVRKELMAARTPDGEPCAVLAGVNDAADPLDGIAWTYPLNWHQDARGIFVPGPAPPGGKPGYQSAAALIAEQVADIDPGPDAPPMALVWGPSIALKHPSWFWKGCHPGESLERLLVPGVLRQFWGDAEPVLACPTHPTLSMSQVNQLEPDELAPYLTNTYVFIGARISGHDDYALSPVQGRLPGVYAHAMALDNLLVYRNAYKQQGAWGLPPSPGLLGPGVIVVSLVFGVHVLLRRLLRIWEPRYATLWRPGRDAGVPNRLRGLLLRSAAWLVRVWVQLIVALFLIVLLQRCFRIGMLPLIELIGMTLLAEGLGYLNAVRRFFATGQAAGNASSASAELRASAVPSPSVFQEKTQ